jgi:hypothetical protein
MTNNAVNDSHAGLSTALRSAGVLTGSVANG